MSDGTVIPSYLKAEDRAVDPHLYRNVNSLGFRVGEVKNVIYPGGTGNSSNFVKYTVEVAYKDGTSPYSSTLYHNCIVSSLFGGFADRFTYTLRSDTNQNKNNNNSNVGVGSKVLLLCVNGNTNNAVILGGLPDIKAGDIKESKEQGHNLFFEFNGCQFTVNNDGEVQLQFRGATKVDGKLTDTAVPGAEGTFVKVTKDGNLQISTPDENQFLTFNHKDKKIEILAQKEWNLTVKGSALIQTDEHVTIKSTGVLVGDATDAWVKGTTYRTAEGISNKILSTQFKALSALMSTAGASILTAAPLNAIPIVGGILALPAFLSAGTTITSMGPMMTAMGAAIDTLEGGSTGYLSKKNFTD